jgi:hypothetical protein
VGEGVDGAVGFRNICEENGSDVPGLRIFCHFPLMSLYSAGSHVPRDVHIPRRSSFCFMSWYSHAHGAKALSESFCLQNALACSMVVFETAVAAIAAANDVEAG